MKFAVLVAASLVSVVLSGPVPQSQLQRYTISRPTNVGVPLHSAARQLNSQRTNGQFLVTLDDQDSREGLSSLQGLGNFATSQVGAIGSIAGNAQFSVDLDDSIESDEIGLGISLCPAGQLRHGLRCVVPRINRNIFVFGKDDPPEPKSVDYTTLPLPELDYNIIFVRSRPHRTRNPVIVPPPQKKTVVYVLEDEKESSEEFIEVPGHPDADPEVYYVKVRPGENPQLPGGLDLQTAYSQAIQPLQGDTSFESSIELTIGAGGGGGIVGVPLPNVAGGASFGGQATFNSAPGGFATGGGIGVPLPQNNFQSGPVGVPLPNGFQGGVGGVGINSFQGGSFQGAGFQGAGFQGGVGGGGVPLPSTGFQGGVGNVGVPLPQNSFQGGIGGVGVALPQNNFQGGVGGVGVALPPNNFQGGAGFNAGISGDNLFQSNAFPNTGFAKGLEVEVDDGKLNIEANIDEAVKPAIRFQIPAQG